MISEKYFAISDLNSGQFPGAWENRMLCSNVTERSSYRKTGLKVRSRPGLERS